MREDTEEIKEKEDRGQMPFKFTLLGLEISSGKNLKCEKSEMKKLKVKTKLKKQQKKFAKYSKLCHKEPTQKKYYKCMSKNLKKN